MEGFGPLVSLRHASLLRWGTKTLLAAQAESVSDATDTALWGREWLRDSTQESTGKRYNEAEEGGALLLNAAARPGRGLLALTSKRTPFAAYEGGRLVAARVHLGGIEPGVVTVRQGARMGRRLERLDAPKGSVFEGYWDLIEGNGLAIGEQAPEYRDREPLPQSAHSRGPASNLRVEGGADVEHHVTFDARLGPVVVEKGASVESFSRVMGPCYIGRRTKVLSALVGGGTSVFEGCKVGGQLENTIVMPNTNKAHHGYVGDSYVGEWVNLGAGSTFSNLKNTYGTVRVRAGAKERDTGMTKLGPFLGDMAKVSIGALVYSGRSIGPGSLVSGLVSEDVPSFTYHDGSSEGVELLLESVIETQRRMMERRDKELSRAQEKLIRRVFSLTAAERRKAGVRKGRIG